MPQDRAQGSSIELLVIGDDELREWIITPKDDVTGALSFHDEPGTRECLDALPPRNTRQLRQTATTSVSKRSSGTGR
jgi:hypothetical protein